MSLYCISVYPLILLRINMNHWQLLCITSVFPCQISVFHFLIRPLWIIQSKKGAAHSTGHRLSATVKRSLFWISYQLGWYLLWCHCFECEADCISSIWFTTKGLKLLLCALIQHSTFMLSIQIVHWSLSISKAVVTDRVSLNPNTALINSSPDMLTAISGATLDFAVTNLTDTLPSSNIHLW